MSAPDYQRYVGRGKNSQILKRGYTALTTELDITTQTTFLSSICTNLTSGILAMTPDAGITSDGTSFTVTLKDATPATTKIDFKYTASTHTANPLFMQAIAQFLLMTFVQLFVDVKDKSTDMPKCIGSVQAALGIVINPIHTKTRALTEITCDEKTALLKSIASVLSDVAHSQRTPPIPGSVTSIANLDADILNFTLRSPMLPKKIDFTGVNDVYDIMIYNANIAATLLLAAQQTENASKASGVSALLDKLAATLTAYTEVTGKTACLGAKEKKPPPAGGGPGTVGIGCHFKNPT